jgi:putative transposase
LSVCRADRVPTLRQAASKEPFDELAAYGCRVPRTLRAQVEGGIYHVTANGATGRSLFRSREDFEQFLATLARVISARDWSLRSYCLLNTHYHLFVETPDGDIAAGMQFLNARYAEWVNASRGEKGHVFRARYDTVLVTAPGHLIEVHRYIALNPVRAFLCARAEDWPWSSYGQVLDLVPARPFLDIARALADFGESPQQARRLLKAFVDDAPVSTSAMEAKAA